MAGTSPAMTKTSYCAVIPDAFYDARQLSRDRPSSGWRVVERHWFSGMSEMESRR